MKLTPAEHFVAHQLLCKMHPNVKNLAYALVRMTGNPRTNNKLYGWMRKRVAAASSIILKRSLGDPDFRKKAREASIKALKDPRHRQKMSEIMTEVNKNVPKDEKKRRKNKNSQKSKEYHAKLDLEKKKELYEKINATKKKNGSYEKWASMVSENRKQYWEKVREEGTLSELTKRMVESRREKSGYTVSPEARKRLSAASRRMWEDRREKGGYKSTFVPNEEQRRKMSEASKAYWASKKKSKG